MAERFSDMVLSTFSVPWVAARATNPAYNQSEFMAYDPRELAIAQHEADMAHEIACPCGCHNSMACKAIQGTALANAWVCPMCPGTGRVTLGALVAADRARKEAT